MTSLAGRWKYEEKYQLPKIHGMKFRSGVLKEEEDTQFKSSSESKKDTQIFL